MIPTCRKYQLILLVLATLCFLRVNFVSAEVSESVGSRRQLLIAAAKDALEARKPFIALRQLSLINGGNNPDAQTLAIVIEAFEQLAAGVEQVESMQESRSALEDGPVSTLIESAIAEVPELKEIYLQLLMARTISFAKQGNYSGIQASYQLFRENAPSNSVLHNQLSFQVIETAVGQVKDQFSPMLISELRQGGFIGFFDYIHFFMKGYFVGMAGRNMILSVLAILFIGLIYVVVIGRQDAEVLGGEPILLSKKRVLTAEDLISENDEYSRHLSVLGLDDSASEDEIKQAHRRLIKELHPDGQSAANNPEVLKRFREVQYSYKRIKEMKEGWFSS